MDSPLHFFLMAAATSLIAKRVPGKPWPDAPQNGVLGDCLQSPGGDVAVPFKTNSCGQPKASSRPLRAQN
jgi:hypothetical protein